VITAADSSGHFRSCVENRREALANRDLRRRGRRRAGASWRTVEGEIDDRRREERQRCGQEEAAHDCTPSGWRILPGRRPPPKASGQGAEHAAIVVIMIGRKRKKARLVESLDGLTGARRRSGLDSRKSIMHDGVLSFTMR